MIFERCSDEALEKRVGLIRSALEFGVELNADIEIPVGKLNRFNKSSVG